jgi:hypothetical protein
MLRAMKAYVRTGVLAAGVMTLLGSGCAYGELRQVLRAEFASETGCREVSIRRRDTWYAYSENFYKVSGCGQLRSYTCPAGDGIVKYGSSGCTWVAGDMDAPTAPKPASDPTTEPMPEDSPPPSMDEPSSSMSSDSDGASADSSDDDLGSSDLSGDAEATPKKASGKAKAGGSLRIGH